jgi:DNA-binding beta-propeller fold protein YncE
VSDCPIETDGLFGTCTTLNDATFGLMTGITLSPSGDYLYTSNFGTGTGDGSVSICPVNHDGSLASCASSGNMGGLFAYPEMIGVNPVGTLLYSSGVANQLSMTLCAIAAGSGSLSACTTASGSGPAPDPGFLAPQGISLNAQGTIAYIGNSGNSGPISNFVSICPVNPDGSFGSCTITDGNGTFNFTANAAIGLFISSATQLAYVPNDGSNTVSICPIEQDGSLGVCTTSDGGGSLNQPSAIFLASVPGP